jgi:hypothetical protein
MIIVRLSAQRTFEVRGFELSESGQFLIGPLKLRARLPNLKIAVGLWGATENIPQADQRLRDSGANEVVTTLARPSRRPSPRRPDRTLLAKRDMARRTQSPDGRRALRRPCRSRATR